MSRFRPFVIAVLLAAFASCSADSEMPPSSVPDAGEEAFVKRVLPLMWGRKPTSIREVAVLVDIANTVGRSELVRLMAQSVDFRDHWASVFKDILGVYRIGDPTNVGCYGTRAFDDDSTTLAEFVRDAQPDGPDYALPFTMVDLIRSALMLGDLSPVYRANLFAQLKEDYALPHAGAARASRQAKAEIFMRTTLGRRQECLGCHNSEFSVSGSADPDFDRTWEIPGLFEKALFGVSTGRDTADLRPFFRRFGVVAGVYYDGSGPQDEETLAQEIAAAHAPWGMDDACGRFRRPNEVWDDDLEDTAFLGADYDRNASVWDLESRLEASFAALRGGLQVASNGDVGSDDAMGWLLATNLTDRIWFEAFGHRLTIANYFPRTRQQRDMLDTMTRRFVDSGYSLTELLVAITTSEYFNAPFETEAGELQVEFVDLFNPWVDDGLAPADRKNSPADLVHRWPARTLIRSVNEALGWYPPNEFPSEYLSEAAILQRQVGVYLKDGDPGFSGVGFQSQLAWEDAYGACEDRGPCPLIAIATEGPVSEADRCELCHLQEDICDFDDRCCAIEWDGWCPETCPTPDPAFDLARWLTPPESANWIVRLVKHAKQEGATLGDAVAALKDRLLTDPVIEAGDETALLETLLDAPLSTPAASDEALEERIRRACSLMLATPQFSLSGFPGPDRLDRAFDGLVAPETTYTEACERLAIHLPGALTCGTDSLELRF
ncbi:MAG: hypothetical protein ACI9OJ_000687 [Myxococcota bacterium]